MQLSGCQTCFALLGVALLIVGACTTNQPDLAPTPVKSVNPEREACQSAKDRMFDIAIDVARIRTRIARASTYEAMAEAAKRRAWDTRLAELLDELIRVDAGSDAGLRFAHHLLEEAIAEELRGVQGLLQARPPFFDIPEETPFALRRGAILLQDASMELGAVSC